MKKSNVAIVLVLLLLLHGALFHRFFLRGGRAAHPASPVATNARSPSVAAPAGTGSPVAAPAVAPVDPATGLPADFPFPKIAYPPPQPVERAEKAAPAGPRVEPAAPEKTETIAVPGARDGFLRRDLPDRRTTKIFPRLVGKPCRGYILVDARTGRILDAKNPHAYAYPASITKLMTLLLVLEAVERGEIHLSDKVRITPEVARQGGSQIWLDMRESGRFTVDDLLYAMIVHSANDAAMALALHVAGSREAFVKRMNRRARELGMNATVYHSPNGLPPGKGRQPDISTPYDIALLSLAVLRRPLALRYTASGPRYLRGGKTLLSPRNALLACRSGGIPGCDGLKTGYHREGGWSIAATARRNGQRVVAIVLGAPDKKSRNALASRLLEEGFRLLSRKNDQSQ